MNKRLNENARALGTNRSVIMELFEYGARCAARGEQVFDYSIGNPSTPAPPEVNRAVRQLLEEMPSPALHGYTPSAGDTATREAIARELNRRYGAGADADDLFIGSGAAPELAAVFRALTVPGAEILTIAPYFPEYKPYVEAAGAVLKVVPPDIPDFQIRLESVEAMLTPNTAAVIINSPNNPSGTVYTRQTLCALAELLREKSRLYKHPIYIVSDDPYRELVYGGVEVPFLPLIYPDTVVCYSYSKSLSLPGERIGYIYVPKAAADSRLLYATIAGAARSMGHVCAPSLMQKVLARCAHLQPNLEIYDRNRRTLYENLTEMGYEMPKPDGAFYLFIKAPGGDANAFSEKAKEKNLLLVPGDSFGCPGYFRICYCVDHDMILSSLPIFRQLLEE